MRAAAGIALGLAASASAAALPAWGLSNITSTVTGLYIRHCDFVAFANPTSVSDYNAQDFTFLVVSALNGQAGAVSLESVNYPGYYLAPGDSTGGPYPRIHALQAPDAHDASWAVQPVGSATTYSLTSLSLNASFAGLYMSQASTLTGMCASRYSAPAGDVVLAPPSAAGIVAQTWAFNAQPPPSAAVAIDTSTVTHRANKGFFGAHVDPGYVSQPLSWSPSLLFSTSFEPAGSLVGIYSWRNVSSPGVVGYAALDNTMQVNPNAPAPSLLINVTSASIGSGASLGQANLGIGAEGLAWQAAQSYEGYAIVFAPGGATLYFGAHLRDGTVAASATVTVLASSAWQRVNFSFVPAVAATCEGIPWGSDPTISCGNPNSTAGGSLPAVNPGQVCVRCGGQYVVGLAAPGAVWVGFTDFYPGAWAWLAGPDGRPVWAQKRTTDIMAAMGISVIRQGGTVSQTFAWRDWRGPFWQRAAMQHYWGGDPMNRLVPVTWGPFEFVDMANAAGIEPILTLAWDQVGSADPVSDWADLIEYAWGNASTPWGAVRAFNDSHPEPYAITTFEIGNEQRSPQFVATVQAMEARAAAVGAPALRYLYPSNSFDADAAAGILALGGAELAARTSPDVHVWGSRGGIEMAQSDADGLPDYPSSFMNCEVNARTSTLVRAVEEAADLCDWLGAAGPLQQRLLVRTSSFATERSGHFDGYDQGLVYFLPNVTWLQPPGWTHAMVTAALDKAANALAVTVNGGAAGTGPLAACAQLSDDGGLLVVHLANTDAGPAATVVNVSLTPDFVAAGDVQVTTLTDPAADPVAGIAPNPNAGNTPYQPDLVSPVQSTLFWPRGAPSAAVTVPPLAYIVLEIPRAG